MCTVTQEYGHPNPVRTARKRTVGPETTVDTNLMKVPKKKKTKEKRNSEIKEFSPSLPVGVGKVIAREDGDDARVPYQRWRCTPGVFIVGAGGGGRRGEGRGKALGNPAFFLCFFQSQSR